MWSYDNYPVISALIMALHKHGFLMLVALVLWSSSGVYGRKLVWILRLFVYCWCLKCSYHETLFRHTVSYYTHLLFMSVLNMNSPPLSLSLSKAFFFHAADFDLLPGVSDGVRSHLPPHHFALPDVVPLLRNVLRLGCRLRLGWADVLMVGLCCYSVKQRWWVISYVYAGEARRKLCAQNCKANDWVN